MIREVKCLTAHSNIKMEQCRYNFFRSCERNRCKTDGATARAMAASTTIGIRAFLTRVIFSAAVSFIGAAGAHFATFIRTT